MSVGEKADDLLETVIAGLTLELACVPVGTRRHEALAGFLGALERRRGTALSGRDVAVALRVRREYERGGP